MTLYEQETVINFSRAESTAIIDTAEPSWKTKLKKLATEYPELYHIVKEDKYFLTVELDKNMIRFKHPHKDKEQVSEDE